MGLRYKNREPRTDRILDPRGYNNLGWAWKKAEADALHPVTLVADEEGLAKYQARMENRQRIYAERHRKDLKWIKDNMSRILRSLDDKPGGLTEHAISGMMVDISNAEGGA